MRTGRYARRTNETDISIELVIEGSGRCEIETGIPFFNHMLHALGKHSGMDLVIRVSGDLDVGPHHTIEDTGIALGRALRDAVGDGSGIRRFGHALVPMDEALAVVAVDCGGRSYLVFKSPFAALIEGQIPGGIICHFFESLCSNAGITANMKAEGTCDHHKCEALFKAFGRALADALSKGQSGIPSTKGVL